MAKISVGIVYANEKKVTSPAMIDTFRLVQIVATLKGYLTAMNRSAVTAIRMLTDHNSAELDKNPPNLHQNTESSACFM